MVEDVVVAQVRRREHVVADVLVVAEARAVLDHSHLASVSVVAEIDLTNRIDPSARLDHRRGGAEARTAVMYHKSWSIIVPEYAWAHSDKWIKFPWSCDGPVVTAVNTDA